MKKIIISLLLVLTTILSLTGCISFNTPTTETTTAEVITLPDAVTTEVSTTEEIITSAPVIETTTIEEITTAIQELVTNEYITLAPETTIPETTTIISETTTETILETIETWKNEKIGLAFNGGDKYKLYDANSINNVIDISLFESIGFVPEMFAMSGTTAAAVITGSNATFNSKLIVSAMKMATSFAEGTKYTGSRTENIAGKNYDAVSMEISTEDGTMLCDYLLREEGNTLVMIMLTYEDSVAKADVLSHFA